MNFVFWTFADDCLTSFMEINEPLQSISKRHKLLVISSGESSKKILEEKYIAEIIECENDMRIKSDLLFKSLKGLNNIDVVVKIDMDALIVDESFLLKKIEENIEPMTIIGRKKRNRNRRQTYIRGGCNATDFEVIKKIELSCSYSKFLFDEDFCESAKKCGAKLKNVDLFEMKRHLSGESPVWHPIKFRMKRKIRFYRKQVETLRGKNK